VEKPNSVIVYGYEVFPWAHQSSTQTASRSLQPFLQDSLGDRPTNHVTRSVTIGGAHSGKAKFVVVYGNNKYLLEQSISQIGSTSAISS